MAGDQARGRGRDHDDQPPRSDRFGPVPARPARPRIGLDLDPLARETEGYVGADIEPVCREAATAVREFAWSKLAIEEVDMTAAHFEEAFQEGDPEGNRPAEGFTVGDT